jgi:hypothetical protein
MTLRRESDNQERTFYAIAKWKAHVSSIVDLVKWAYGTRVFVVGTGDLRQDDPAKQPRLIVGLDSQSRDETRTTDREGTK